MIIEDLVQAERMMFKAGLPSTANYVRKAADIIRICHRSGLVDVKGDLTEPPSYHGWRSVPPDGYVLCSDGVARRADNSINVLDRLRDMGHSLLVDIAEAHVKAVEAVRGAKETDNGKA